ncbi:DNA integrity scanning protein DisA nucleotide-binding domain protein [Methanocella sp. MCL-LM]|uniref:DNA integrity scanning protein DisA nucleotide-binding domain protein n=1 Tax=Methanocella sp. MCL-LM TaxID=3412035 RepID=UPI003C7101E1
MAAEVLTIDEREVQEEKVMDVILGVAKGISKSGEGGLIVIAERADIDGLFETHYPQFTTAYPVTEKGMNVVLEKLATIDGSVLITPRGELVAFGARLLRSTTLPGFGTRHAAASGITESLPNATAILISEESSWIKVFQKGSIVLEMDSSEVNPNVMEKVATFLTRGDTALLAAAFLSIVVLPVAPQSIVYIGGAYLIVKSTFETISSLLKGIDSA